MNAQSAKTPTLGENVTLILTPEELTELYYVLDYYSLNYSISPFFEHLHFKVKDLKNIGDACATPSHIPEAPGQGGTITCHLCEGRGSYIKLNSSKFSECGWCRGSGIGLRSVEGGNQ